jgi:transcriptional regulator with XRE-family HTH domain
MPRVPKGTEYLDADSIRRIFDRMNSLGMKRVELSRSLGFSNGSYITRLEKGEIRIQKAQVAKWASALQTTPEYILGETDDASSVTYLDKKSMKMRQITLLRENMTDSEFKLWIKIGQDILNARTK